MGQNSRIKQKQAAELLLGGSSKKKICEALNIRESTLVRWRRSPSFIAQLETLKGEMQQDIEVQWLNLTEDALHAALYMLSYNHSSPKALSQALACLKALKLQPTTLPKPAKTSPKSPPISINDTKSCAEPPQIVPEPPGFSFIPNIKTL